MSKKILNPDRDYSFSDYFRLNFAIKDILRELDCYYSRTNLKLPKDSFPQDRTELLKQNILTNLEYIRLTSEDARKQAVIAPILFELCKTIFIPLNIEYPISVSYQLKGTLDYYIDEGKNFVIIEAKHTDIIRGFTQLAVELIALDQWVNSDSDTLYGAVTTGEDWRFGTFDRVGRIINEDTKLYRIPEELQELMDILKGICI